jgi:hypothetical protein
MYFQSQGGIVFKDCQHVLWLIKPELHPMPIVIIIFLMQFGVVLFHLIAQCAYELMNRGIPALSARHAIVDDWPFWNFETSPMFTSNPLQTI